MSIFVGKAGLKESYQAPFEPNIKCQGCGANARHAFTAIEEQGQQDGQYVCELHENKIADGGAFWPHDAVAVAIYFCEKHCSEPVSAVYNQG